MRGQPEARAPRTVLERARWPRPRQQRLASARLAVWRAAHPGSAHGCLHGTPSPRQRLHGGTCQALGARLTSTVVLPEKLLAVIGGVRLLHLGDPVPGHLPLEGRGEEGRPVVPLWGRGSAEGGHLGTRSPSHWSSKSSRGLGAPGLLTSCPQYSPALSPGGAATELWPLTLA